MTAGALDTRIRVTGATNSPTSAATLQADAATLRAMESRARRFAADVSHELRTPLAAMTAVAGGLNQDAGSGRLAPDTVEALELVADETNKFGRMVEDLMEISRFDAGAAALDLDEIDIGELVRKTLALRHWQDRVGVDVPQGLRARLDPRRIDVVLANLIGNALRHGWSISRLQSATCTAVRRASRTRFSASHRLALTVWSRVTASSRRRKSFSDNVAVARESPGGRTRGGEFWVIGGPCLSKR
ncbi:sensor histidine kinase [Streptomyces nigrescens]|uniref:sensor histidine kinase n=1 Tax=Streptomyces nigrescens TaxID=1920 RepID=UPI003F4D0472